MFVNSVNSVRYESLDATSGLLGCLRNANYNNKGDCGNEDPVTSSKGLSFELKVQVQLWHAVSGVIFAIVTDFTKPCLCT